MPWGKCKPGVARSSAFSTEARNPKFYMNSILKCWQQIKERKKKKTYCGSQIKHSCGPDLTYQPPVCNLSSRSTWPTQFMCGNSWNGPQIHWHNSYLNCNETLKLDKLTYIHSTVNKHEWNPWYPQTSHCVLVLYWHPLWPSSGLTSHLVYGLGSQRLLRLKMT